MSEVDLTLPTYRLWLRAQRPQPITWFLSLSKLEQEALAEEGDAYVASAVDTGLQAYQEGEETMAQALAQMAAARAQNGASSNPPPVSLSGSLGKSLFGKPPDDLGEEVTGE